MKIIIFLSFFLAFSLSLKSQTDTIFKKNGETITCTITLINDKNIFYKDKHSDGKYISLEIITNYSQNGLRNGQKAVSTPLDPNAVPKIYVDGVDINALAIKYCTLRAFFPSLSYEVEISIDYGQRIGSWDETKIAGSDGKIIKFISLTSALNYFYSNGWEFVTPTYFSDKSKDCQYLLKRIEKK